MFASLPMGTTEQPKHGGSICRCKDIREKAMLKAPDAPNVCPVDPFVELIATL